MAMNFLEKQKLARTNDMSKEAVCARFKAAVAAAGYEKQKDFADALGNRGVSSISNVYKEMYYPSREMISLLYMQHRIDFNFVLAGQFNQLPADVQELIFENL